MTDFPDDLFDIYDEPGQKRPNPNQAQHPYKRHHFQEEIDEILQNEELVQDYSVQILQESGCRHEVIIPNGWQQEAIPTRERAKQYPFTLDPFQVAATDCLDKKQSVLVAAHTSAGKTAVAEYAIATALRDQQRVIYTSPIKALSNQKYRELQDQFQNVGLITGDVTQNEDASCIVMTTEILRSMLYRGSELIGEIAWVIFDEIHYMRDVERGVVWEETIIMLPNTVRLVFLSATISNAREFAEWICKIKKQPCNVVYTEFRPVPLQHYIYPSGGDGLYLVVDQQGNFREQNFQQAISFLGADMEGRPQKKIGAGQNSEVVKIVQLIIQQKFEPAIIFSFSKRDCEAHAQSLQRYDFTTDDEKTLIEDIYNNAMNTLSEEDRNLPFILNMLPILKRGIGIHHGGLLPIIKEVTEVLFQENLVKALFSTETFSMGLNMPAKTVVFTSVRKFDGSIFRWIGSGEYIQMSGRAGRRGLDVNGNTILMVDQKMEPDVAKGILKGNVDPLNSSFHLGYNMLLNLMLLEGVNAESIIKQSFHQFQCNKAAPKIIEERKQLIQQLNEIQIDNENEWIKLQQDENMQKALKSTYTVYLQEPQRILKWLSTGRIIHVTDQQGVN